MDMKLPRVRWVHAPGETSKKNPEDVYEMVDKYLEKLIKRQNVQDVEIALTEDKNAAGLTEFYVARIKVYLEHGKILMSKAEGYKSGEALHKALEKIITESVKLADKVKTAKKIKNI